MKRKKKKRFLAFLLLAAALVGVLPTEPMYAATSFTNAKEFYESTGLDGEQYHAETRYGKIYYATKAKLASSSSNERYYTLGFDITLSGNGHSVSFAVQRTGGSMIEVGEPIKSGGYEYILYAVEEDALYSLATAANPTEAAYVLSASTITVVMNAIMTTRLGNSLRGSVTENGSGGLYESGSVYHLKDYSHLMAMMRKFAGHDFMSYRNIRERLDNPSLLIQYDVQGTTGGSVSVGGGFGISGGILTMGGAAYRQISTLLQPVNLLNPAAIGLSKPGYYLEPGKEWIAVNRSFTPSKQYMPMDIYPRVANGNTAITMVANWQGYKYFIGYDANGGEGYVEPSTGHYGENLRLRTAYFTRRGYSLKEGAEWNTKADGSGTSYSSGQIVKNLGSKHLDSITLYAQWEPNIYQITTDPLKGTGGTLQFFVKFATGWFEDIKATVPLANNTIEVPTRVGYTFKDYRPYPFDAGTVLVNGDGKIAVNADYFDKDSTIYAMYTPNIYKITFDKMGGTGGTDSVDATFDAYLPKAQAPKKAGYTFMGYYDNDTYTGELYYLKTMAANRTYTVPNDITLYAKWVDDTPPGTTIAVETDLWTNKANGIAVEAKAWDSGSGLDKVELYCGDDTTPVASLTDLEGSKETVTLNWVHLLEGAYRYKVVAYDMEGNSKEAYSYVRYDIKAPSGAITDTNNDLGNFGVDVDANDYNIVIPNITMLYSQQTEESAEAKESKEINAQMQETTALDEVETTESTETVEVVEESTVESTEMQEETTSEENVSENNTETGGNEL